MTTTADMDNWNMNLVAPDPLLDPDTGDVIFDLTDYEAVSRDWSQIAGYSNVDVSRLDLGIGARYHSSTGWGVELSYLWTDYDDNDPILEDETGKYSQTMLLIGKHF